MDAFLAQIQNDCGADLDERFKPPDCFCCPVCLSVFHKPLMLPCSHTVCRTCVERLHDTARKENLSFQCPVCRENLHTVMTNGGIDNLPTNRSLIEAHGSWEKEMKRQRKAFIVSQISVCTKHPSEPMDLACKTCANVGCTYCFEDCKENDHQLEDGKEYLEIIADKLNLSWDVWVQSKDLVDAIKLIGNREKTMESLVNEYMESINNAENKLQTTIVDKFKKIRKDASDKFKDLLPQQRAVRDQGLAMLNNVSYYFKSVHQNSLNADSGAAVLQQETLDKIIQTTTEMEVTSAKVNSTANALSELFLNSMNKVTVILQKKMNRSLDMLANHQLRVGDEQSSEIERRMFSESLGLFVDDAFPNPSDQIPLLTPFTREPEDDVDAHVLTRSLADRMNSLHNRLTTPRPPARTQDPHTVDSNTTRMGLIGNFLTTSPSPTLSTQIQARGSDFNVTPPSPVSGMRIASPRHSLIAVTSPDNSPRTLGSTDQPTSQVPLSPRNTFTDDPAAPIMPETGEVVDLSRPEHRRMYNPLSPSASSRDLPLDANTRRRTMYIPSAEPFIRHHNTYRPYDDYLRSSFYNRDRGPPEPRQLSYGPIGPPTEEYYYNRSQSPTWRYYSPITPPPHRLNSPHLNLQVERPSTPSPSPSPIPTLTPPPPPPPGLQRTVTTTTTQTPITLSTMAPMSVTEIRQRTVSTVDQVMHAIPSNRQTAEWWRVNSSLPAPYHPPPFQPRPLPFERPLLSPVEGRGPGTPSAVASFTANLSPDTNARENVRPQSAATEHNLTADPDTPNHPPRASRSTREPV